MDPCSLPNAHAWLAVLTTGAVRALLPFCMACSLLPLLFLPRVPLPPTTHPPTTSIMRCADAQGGQPHEL
jgi:hypothetical protein